MEYRVDTSILRNALDKKTFMPYFLNEDNNLFFKENLMELYAQLEEEDDNVLYYKGKKISEKNWAHTKFVGSLFTTLYCHWAKIIKDTNIFYIEMLDDFPSQVTLDMDDKSFIIFYHFKDGMICKRDECIYDTDNGWINSFFDWLYVEINDVGNIEELAKKYKAFTEIFSSSSMPLEKEDDQKETYYEFPDEFYLNIDTMKASILASLEEMAAEMNDGKDPLGFAVSDLLTNEDSIKLNNLDEDLQNTPVPPLTVNFNWNKTPISITYPLDMNSSWIEGIILFGIMDNKNGWLAQQEHTIKEGVLALWAMYVHQSNMIIGKNSEEVLDLSWSDFGTAIRDILRDECTPEAKKIDKVPYSVYDRIGYAGRIASYSFPLTIEKFLKAILFIEKQAAIDSGKLCLMDVENIQNQYFYALTNAHTLEEVWTSITYEKIIKGRTRTTYASQFDALKEKFPNFTEVIEYYSGAMYIFEQTGTPPAPVLMLGSPGLGKTHFSNELAKVVGSMMTLIPVSSLTAGWVISGAAAQWKDAQMGKVASALLNGSSMSPVIVLDEIDKKSEGNYDPLGALYPLLEYQTAKEFVDEFLEFPLDASNVIWIATANNLNTIPEPILDRFVVFDVAKLSKEETIKVAKNIFSDLTRGLSPENLSAEILEILQDKTPRQIKQVLKKALAYAAVQRTHNIVLEKGHLDMKTKIKKIGF